MHHILLLKYIIFLEKTDVCDHMATLLRYTHWSINHMQTAGSSLHFRCSQTFILLEEITSRKNKRKTQHFSCCNTYIWPAEVSVKLKKRKENNQSGTIGGAIQFK